MTELVLRIPWNVKLDPGLAVVNHDVGVYENAPERIRRERDVKPNSSSEAGQERENLLAALHEELEAFNDAVNDFSNNGNLEFAETRVAKIEKSSIRVDHARQRLIDHIKIHGC